jgi:hypothetical protein
MSEHTVEFAPQIDYSKKTLLNPSYRISKVVPLTGMNPTLAISSTTNAQFELQTNIFNLSRSRLCFDIQIPASGASNYTWIQADPLSLFDRIQLYTRGGIALLDLQGINNMSALITPYVTQTNTLTQRSAGGNILQAGGNYLAPTTTVTVPNSAITDSQQTPIQGIQIFNDNTRTSNFRPDDTSAVADNAQVNYSEQRYLFNTLVNNTICLSYQLNLHLLAHSICAIDRDLYFGENLILSLTYAPATKYCWTTTTQFPSPSTAITVTPLVTNLALYLSIETNPVVCENLKAKVQSPEGFSIIVPFVYSQKYSAPSGSAGSIFQRFNRGHGSRISRFYWGVFNATESGSTTLDHSNIQCSKVINYYTTMNNMRCQEFPVDCTASLDWLVNNSDIDNTAILSVNQYKYLFCHMENYSGQRPSETDDSIINGLSLDEEKTFGVYIVSPSAMFLNHWLFTVVQRELKIGGGQIMFV